MATLEDIKKLEQIYAESQNLILELKKQNALLERAKTKEEVVKIEQTIIEIKRKIEDGIIKFGSAESILSQLETLRKEFLRPKYVTLSGSNSIKVDDDKVAELKSKNASVFKIEVQPDIIRGFQNENVYLSIDLNTQEKVAIMLPSIKSLNNSLNLNIWLSDISGSIDGDFSLEIIGDENSKDTISGLESVVITESFSGALLTPIANKQWAIFYASNITKGTYVSEIESSIDDLQGRELIGREVASPITKA